MKTIKTIFYGTLIGFLPVLAGIALLCSCDDDLEVSRSSPFKVSLMPYRSVIDYNRPVELRFTLSPEKPGSEVLYTVRQFQYAGYGTLTYKGTVLRPNDKYRVEPGDFRMYFNAPPGSGTSFEMEIVFEDNFGRSETIKLEFRADTD